MLQGVWMDSSEKAIIEKYLNPNVIMMEWGSGGSTIEFSKQVKEYYSVEHNLEWYNEVKAAAPVAKAEVKAAAPVAKAEVKAAAPVAKAEVKAAVAEEAAPVAKKAKKAKKQAKAAVEAPVATAPVAAAPAAVAPVAPVAVKK